MAFENTGFIKGRKAASILIAPASAYVIAAKCNYGCAEAFFVGGRIWIDDIEEATIYRSYEGAGAALEIARSGCTGCLKEQGVIFDIKPLAGFLQTQGNSQ